MLKAHAEGIAAERRRAVSRHGRAERRGGAGGGRAEHRPHGGRASPARPRRRRCSRAAAEALNRGRLGYTEALGIRPLRERIARHYREAYGVECRPARVMVTTGSSGGFNLVFLGAFDAGDRIAMASPAYPAYRNILKALGLEAVEIEVGPDTRWALTAEHVERAHREAPLAGVLVASPANPTGTMTAPEELRRLVEMLRRARHPLHLRRDLSRPRLCGPRARRRSASATHAIVVNSFSKYYCMTGWRVGWLVLPEELVRPFERLSQSLYISVPELSQRAAIAAFDATAELEAVKDGYRAKPRRAARAAAGDRLRRAAAGRRRLLRLCLGRALHQRRARLRRRACCARRASPRRPGRTSTTRRGHRYMRFSFAGTEADIAEGIERLAHWLK